MQTLVLGGTGFLGSAIAEAAVRAGHDVAVLARGETTRPPPDGARALRGDRHDALDVLNGEAFDLVFDTCAYTPEAVTSFLEALAAPPTRYALISSASVYGDFAEPFLTETAHAPTATPQDLDVARALPARRRTDADAYGPAYGRLKRACEIAAEAALGDRALLLRAGLLVGAGDPTDRLTWWTRRIDEGGRIPVPTPWNRSVQMIDVRDVAEFAVAAAAAGLSGPYNVTSPDMPFALLLETSIEVARSDAELVWIDERRFWQAEVKPWSDLPLVTPPAHCFRHFLQIDTQKARRDGLACRPIAETLQRLLAWDRANRDRPLACGVSRDQESAVLA